MCSELILRYPKNNMQNDSSSGCCRRTRGRSTKAGVSIVSKKQLFIQQCLFKKNKVNFYFFYPRKDWVNDTSKLFFCFLLRDVVLCAVQICQLPLWQWSITLEILHIRFTQRITLINSNYYGAPKFNGSHFKI